MIMEQMMSLLVISVFVFGATIIGVLPGLKGKSKNLEEWAVGGRSFPRWLNWFVLAGEIYTAFAFLGASGWAYSRGGPTFYILGYGGLAYVLGYWILPKLAPLGRKYNLMTQPDLIEKMYGSKLLGVMVAIVGVAFLIPYLQLQLTGLGLIIETCSFGLLSKEWAMIISFVLVAGFVYLSGLHGVASTAVIKDIVMILAVVGFGLYIPYHFYGGVGPMFEALDAAKPGFLTFPGATQNLDVLWAMTTIALTAIGFYMWPHFSASAFAAKNSDVLRHNAVYLPLYNLCLIFPMLVGFTAVLVLVPALPGAEADKAFMVMVQRAFSPWVLGLVGGAGALACMIPAAELTLTTSMLVTRNILGRAMGNQMSDESTSKIARLMVIALTIVALYLAIYQSNALVELLITGYTGVTQFFPMIVLGLFWKKSTKIAAFVSLIVGESLVYYLLIVAKMSVIPVPALGGHMNAGFGALLVNLAVFILVSLLTYKSSAMVVRE